MADDHLKEQLKRWREQHAPAAPPAPPSPPRKGPGTAPARASAPPESAAPPPPRPLTDRELFEQAVKDLGDGAVAILEKYGHGHLSGEGEPEAGGPGPAAERDAEEPRAAEAPRGGAHLGEAAMFFDAVAGATPLGRDADRAGRGQDKRGRGDRGTARKPKR